MRSVHVLGLSFALALTACAIPGNSKPARAQEAALETNLNARFGRIEMAVEHVAPKSRDAFLERRRSWGSAIRIADYDMVGLKMTGEETCETVMRVSWYRSAENDLRSTSVKQKWHETKTGDWELVDEKRLDGDPGLLGDPMPAPSQDAAAQAAAPRRTQFPTVTLGTTTTTSGTIGGGNIGVMNVPPPPVSRPTQAADPSAEMPR